MGHGQDARSGMVRGEERRDGRKTDPRRQGRQGEDGPGDVAGEADMGYVGEREAGHRDMGHVREA